MTSRSAGLAALLVFSSLACDDSGAGLERIDTVRAPIVGTPASMLRTATTPGVRSSLPSSFALKTDTGETIAVVARDYEFTGDYLAVDGAAAESERSSFILKGDGQNIYGWLVLPERDLAFEYTTSARGERDRSAGADRKDLSGVQRRSARSGRPAFRAAARWRRRAIPCTSATTTARTPTSCRAGRAQRKCSSWTSPSSPSPRRSCGAPGRSSRGRTPRSRSTSRPTPPCTTRRTREIGERPASATRTVVRPAWSTRSGPPGAAPSTTRAAATTRGTRPSHELGHLMGLDHDGGSSSTEYFDGFSPSNGFPSWVTARPRPAGARRRCFSGARASTAARTNTQDDLAIITKNLPYREDDIPDAKALVIASGGQVSSVDNRGQIARNTDSDTFTFAIGSGGGRATLVDRSHRMTSRGAYLDVDAEIQNGSGMTDRRRATTRSLARRSSTSRCPRGSTG